VTNEDGILHTLHDRISAFVRRRVRSRTDVEDLVQTISLKMLSHLPTLKERGRIDAWIYRIARNAIADHYRRRRPEPLDESAAPPEADDEIQKEVSGWIPKFMKGLPPAQREILMLADVQGIGQAEIARRLGLSVSGAKSRLQRARRMLRDSILACCELTLDRRGGVLGYRRRRR